MSRKVNFSAGPSTLPVSVLEKLNKDFLDYQGAGLSLIEASHRGPEYDQVHSEATALIKEVLNLPDNYKVLFLQGGATLQFSMIPMNLLSNGRKADYTSTGTWSNKAIADAKKIGTVNIVYNGESEKYATLPKTVKVTEGAEYLHLTSNETIGGIQWQEWPDVDVPIICDMSSDILSREIPVEKFGMIYGGVQKNLGPAGAALVIIRDDLLEKCSDDLTAYLSYKIHAKSDSLYNTPPVFPIWAIKNVLEWIKEMGGLKGIEAHNEKKAKILYDAIDNSNGYYTSPVDPECRSRMNVVWRLPSEDLEKKFIAEAKELGMICLKGHRSVGGCRASIYNAMPIEGVEKLTSFMKDFMEKNS